MGMASDWQTEVVEKLATRRGTILNPRRREWDASWKQTLANPQFVEQVNWELTGIETSDHIAFYFDPKTKSPVTLMELGLAIGLRKRITLACPKGFWRKGNVDIIASRSGITVHHSLDGLIQVLQTLN